MTSIFDPREMLFGIPTNVFYFVALTSFIPFIMIETAAIGTWLVLFLFGYATVRHRMDVALRKSRPSKRCSDPTYSIPEVCGLKRSHRAESPADRSLSLCTIGPLPTLSRSNCT